MENTELPENEYQPSKRFRLSRINKYLLVVFGVFLVTSLVLIYLALKVDKIDKGKTVSGGEQTVNASNPNDSSLDTGDGVRYFEGVRLFQRAGENKRLLVIEGNVEEIDYEKEFVVLGRLDTQTKEKLHYKNEDKVQRVQLVGIGQSSDLVEMSFSDIREGDTISYKPADPSTGTPFATWIVQRYYD